MWPRKKEIAKADQFVAEAERRNAFGKRLAEQAVAASQQLRSQVIENHFTDMLTAAMQRNQ